MPVCVRVCVEGVCVCVYKDACVYSALRSVYSALQSVYSTLQRCTQHYKACIQHYKTSKCRQHYKACKCRRYSTKPPNAGGSDTHEHAHKKGPKMTQKRTEDDGRRTCKSSATQCPNAGCTPNHRTSAEAMIASTLGRHLLCVECVLLL